jgi:hypothetical protein
MGLIKKILFGDDPAHDAIREAWRKAAADRVAGFPFPIQTKRKNRLGRGPYWDPFWSSAVATALKELGVEAIIVNERYCVRTREEARGVRDRAEAIHKERIVEWEGRAGHRKGDGT